MRILLVLLAVNLNYFSPSFAEDKSTEKNQVQYKDLELFNKALYLIQNNYYQDVDSEKLIKGAIRGMLASLDPHSSFLDKDLLQRIKNDTEGEFDGIGIEVSFKDGVLYVITAIDDTPAFEKGIKAGDRIVEINHESALGLALEEAVEKMKGKVGEKLHLGVRRKGTSEILHFNFKRKVIKVKAVKSRLIDGYAYIRLSQFQKDATKQVENALQLLNKEQGGKLKGVLLDLRGNPGGLLDEAVGISSIFLDKGIVVSTESRDPEVKDIRYVRKTGYKDLETPVAILLNGASASASEIVAGALQDHKRAKVIGETSFGKGTVQSLTPIDKDMALKLTIAQYLTPMKRKIHHKGIKPDIKVKENKKNSKEVEIEKDICVKRGIKYIASLKSKTKK